MYTTCSLRPSNTCCGKQRIRSSDSGHGIDLLGTPRPVVAVSRHFDDKTLALTVTTITVTLHLHHAAFQLRRTLSRVPVEVLSNLQDGIEGRETGWERQRRTWWSRWFSPRCRAHRCRTFLPRGCLFEHRPCPKNCRSTRTPHVLIVVQRRRAVTRLFALCIKRTSHRRDASCGVTVIRHEDVLEAVIEQRQIRPDLFLYTLEPADRLGDPIIVERKDQKLVLLVAPCPFDVDGEV